MSSNLEQFLGPELLPLWRDGQRLLSTVNLDYSDYSFIVFPFAKVYEGFLKKLFLQIGAISQEQYDSDHWRVGKALNPQLEKEFRHSESVYDRLAQFCNPSLPQMLWQAWKKGRNQIFHFWPGRNRPLGMEEAKEIVEELNLAMEKALENCKITG